MTKTLIALAVAVVLTCALFAADSASYVSPTLQKVDQIVADNRRKDRRDDRQGDRDDKQDCRQEEGRVGDEKRECKQEERKDDDGEENA